MRIFWQENYHFIVGDYNELLDIFKIISGKTGCKSQILLPEIDGYQWNNINGKNQPIALRKEFYDLIIKTMDRKKTNRVKFLSKEDSKNYEVVRRQCTDDSKHRVIHIYEEDVIII